MATHFSAATANATSTPEAIASAAPITVFVHGVFGAAVVIVYLADVTDGVYIEISRWTASKVFEIPFSGFLKFTIIKASTETSLTVKTVS